MVYVKILILINISDSLNQNYLKTMIQTLFFILIYFKKAFLFLRRSLPRHFFLTMQYHLKSLFETFKAKRSNINTFSICLLLALAVQDEVV